MFSRRFICRSSTCSGRAQYEKSVFPKACLIGLSMMATLPAKAEILETKDVANFSLEELANIRVTSVSKKPESLADAPSSIFVITGQDIRRSGATSLPEALRLAPNLQVAQVDARNYAVTARGFNSPFENKLLVLIDGRTVYSPLFSGVFWDAQDVVLEDVDRIEVVSGPGATLWGANAVNGVINIITRSAAGTQGTLASIGASKEQNSDAVRYGGKLANGGYYRVYGKYADHDDLQRANGSDDFTGWHRGQAGFRADWGTEANGSTVQGDAYSGRLHQALTDDIKIGGANLNGRMKRELDNGSGISLQGYWDYTERNQPAAYIEHLNTWNVDFQHTLTLASVNNVVWGAGYRLAADRVQNDVNFAFLPGDLDMHWANLFVQDQIDLTKAVQVTAGAKLENNNYTGTEFLPTLRLAWKASQDDLVWGSLSRSVRAPSRIDRDLYAPPAPIVINGTPHYLIAGGPDFQSEVANVAEIGYRTQPLPFISFSTTAFYSRYDKLRTLESGPGGLDSVFENQAQGKTRGIEMWGSWQAAKSWRLSAGGVVQHISTWLQPGSTDSSGNTGIATNDPSQYWMLRSSYDFAGNKELDVTLRRVGGLQKPVVPAYTGLDIRFGWKVTRNLDLSLIGQNLIDQPHAEFGNSATASEIDRSVFLKLVWHS